MTRPPKHLLGLEGMNAREIYAILDAAHSFHEILERPVKKVPTLRGRTHDQRLLRGLDAHARRASSWRRSASPPTRSTSRPRGSGMSKGETLRDTVANLEAMAST